MRLTVYNIGFASVWLLVLGGIMKVEKLISLQ